MEMTFEIKKELRPCFCNGKKALFHIWTDKEQPIVKINPMLTEKALERISRKIEGGLIPPHDVVLQKVVFGIVEFEDGSVAEVEPSAIRFVDTVAIMSEYDFGKRKE